jgi:hypothetical protein
MRYLTCLLAALCLSAGTICAQDQPKLSPAEQEVVNVSKARVDAASKRDIAALVGYFADNCIFSTDDGTVITKTELIEHYRKPTAAYDRLVDPRDHIVHVYGNTAVVNYRVSGHEQFGDTDLISEQRRTETWLKQERLLAAHRDAMGQLANKLAKNRCGRSKGLSGLCRRIS